MKNSLESFFINDPHFIGCIPGIDDQQKLAFNCWLNKYKHIVVQDSSIKNKLELFIDQITILQGDVSEWNSFISRWILNRILYNDNFDIIWNKIKNDLNIEEEFGNDDDDDDDNDIDVDAHDDEEKQQEIQQKQKQQKNRSDKEEND